MSKFFKLWPPVIAAIFGFAPTLASAQHFDVFIGRPTSGTTTAFGGIDVDTSAITLQKRIFKAEMGPEPFDGVFLSDEPGFNHPADESALPAGVTSLNQGDEVFVTGLPLTVNGMTSTLFFWNVQGIVNFSPAVNTSFVIDTGNMSGSIGTAGVGGGFDDHPFFILDDGYSVSNTFPTPGIYLASFQARVADLKPAGPLYLVMGTEGFITPEFLGITQLEFDMLSDEDIDALLEGVLDVAAGHVAANVAVPEPGTVSLLTMACCLILASRKAPF